MSRDFKLWVTGNLVRYYYCEAERKKMCELVLNIRRTQQDQISGPYGPA